MTSLSGAARTARVGGVILLLCLPLIAPGIAVAELAVAITITVYRGAHAGTVYGMLAVLVSVEVLYGADVGTLSLSYLVAVGVLALIRRFAAIVPWADRNGWDIRDGVLAFVLSVVLYAVGAAAGVFIGALLYGYTQLVSRVGSLFIRADVVWMMAVVVIVLIVVRRMDVPFRRSIVFGT